MNHLNRLTTIIEKITDLKDVILFNIADIFFQNHYLNEIFVVFINSIANSILLSLYMKYNYIFFDIILLFYLAILFQKFFMTRIKIKNLHLGIKRTIAKMNINNE